MSYQVIARKWRPKTFNQLIGQNHVSQTLLNALKNDRLHHALLFNGPRGTGKTSSARILAKSLRCQNNENFTPCNTCETCLEISEGRNIDTVEIDGASNNGVDAIRELRDTVKYQPTSGKYKVYIIDEVHMLSTSAFNALLKTLEEPPSHVVFILATTEVQKLPLTILSRVQRFDFRRIPTREIADHLEHICSRDEIPFQKEAIWAIARQGDGSMRDSQSLLDQVVTFCNSSLSLENVIEALGLTDRTLLLQTLESLIKRQQSSIIEIIEKVFNSGYDPKLFAQDLLEEIRHTTLIKTSTEQSIELSQIIDLPDSEIEHLKQVINETTEEDLHLLFDMTLKGVNEIVRTENPRIVLEMLLLRMVNAPRLKSIEALLKSVPLKKKQLTETSTQKTEKTTQQQISSAVIQKTSKEPSETKISKPSTPSKTIKYNSNKSHDDNWFQFVQLVKGQNRVLGAKIENLSLVFKDENKIQLAIPSKLSFLKDQVLKPEFIADVKHQVKIIWQENLIIEVHPAEKIGSSKVQSAKDIELNKIEKENARLDEEVKKHPLIQSAQKIFNAKIQSIQPTNSQGEQK